MKFEGNGKTFNTRRGTGCLPNEDKHAYGPIHDYWDLSLEWLKKRGIPEYWPGLDGKTSDSITFKDYVKLARLELYCVSETVASVFLDEARKEDAEPDDIVKEYDQVIAKCEDRKYKVEPFWTGHELDAPGPTKPQNIDQIISFLEAVNLRIEARGRLLIALYEIATASKGEKA